MSEYQQETSLIKARDITRETDKQETRKEGMSRRRFIRNAAIGAAAGSAAIALKGGERAQAQSSESGQVTADAIMLTYIGAPLGCLGSSSWNITKSHAHTMRLVAVQNRSISIAGSVNVDISKNFSVGGSTTYRQTTSTQVTDAITLRRSITQSITSPAPGVVGNTVFLGLRRPQMQFDGDASRLLFRFLRADEQFAVTVSAFQNDPVIQSLFKPATINSFLAQYGPLNDPAGTTLVKPRYKLRLSELLVPGIQDVYTFTKATGGIHSEQKVSTTTVEIVERSGFNVGIVKVAFEVGEKLEFTETAVQEFSTDKIISVSTTLNRTSTGVSQVYWDRVWKTFVIIDKGVPDLSQPTIQGTVTDGYGSPIAGALVKVIQDNAEYAGRTDTSGNYTIATPSAQPLTTGSFPIECGNVSQTVYIGSGTTTVYFDQVDPVAARDTTFEGEALNLN